MTRVPEKRFLWNRPVLVILFSQGLATAIVLLALVPLANRLEISFPMLAWVPIIGAIAALVGWRFGLIRWWVAVQVGFPIAVVGALWLELPSYIWLALFVATLLVYWNSFRGGVPLYLSNKTTWLAIEALLPQRPGIRFIDLGGGIGGTVLYLAACRPDCEFVSIESAPLPFFFSWLRKIISRRSNVQVVYGDFWNHSLKTFDVTYAFLSPRPMSGLYAKVQAEMQKGTIFISNSFEVTGHQADEFIELDDRRRSRLHIWRF